MSREFKHYELKPSPRPIYSGRYTALMSTVSIRGADKKNYYCYVSFSDKLVYKVGKRLPRGVSDFTPAYLFVDCAGGQMEVWARYTREPDVCRVLWSQSFEQPIPDWLKFIPVKETK